MNFQPGATDEQRTKAHVYSFSQRRSKPNVVRSPKSKLDDLFNPCRDLFSKVYGWEYPEYPHPIPGLTR